MNAVPRRAAETRHNAAAIDISAEARPAGTYDTRTRTGSHGPLLSIQGPGFGLHQRVATYR